MTVSGILQSQSGKTYALDFYASAAADPSGYGEGQTYLGSKDVTIAANSNAAPFIFTFSGSVAPGMKITATATDNNGNTSEFSCVAGQCENLLAGFSKDGKGENLGSTPCGSPIVVNVSDDRPNWSETSGTCEVDVNNPAEECSLRAALTAAKNRSGFDWIQFAIPGNAPAGDNAPGLYRRSDAVAGRVADAENRSSRRRSNCTRFRVCARQRRLRFLRYGGQRFCDRRAGKKPE
jgi:hypothetical protein